MWALTVAAVAVALAAAEGGVLYAAAPQDRGQYHRGSGGSYSYGYNTGDGVAKVEVKRADGSVIGSYRYFDPNGKQIVRSYIADSKGFRVLGNDLPISPETPAANIIGAPALTAAVEGASRDVVAASIHPTKQRNTIPLDILSTQPLVRHYQQQQLVFQQQNDLLRQQQIIIEQQQKQLAALTAQPNTNQITTPREQVNLAPKETIQSNTIKYSIGAAGDAPYYYYPHAYNYEFPAGFAFTGGVQVVEEPTVIGVQGVETERNVITAGHRQALSSAPFTVERSRAPQQRRPYVIGRTK